MASIPSHLKYTEAGVVDVWASQARDAAIRRQREAVALLVDAVLRGWIRNLPPEPALAGAEAAIEALRAQLEAEQAERFYVDSERLRPQPPSLA